MLQMYAKVISLKYDIPVSNLDISTCWSHELEEIDLSNSAI